VIRDESMFEGLPDRVAAFHVAYSAPTRFLVLRALMQRAMTFAELRDELPMISLPATRDALYVLIELGYVADNATPGVKRRPSDTVYTAARAVVVRDAMASMAHLLG
jgi:DNA-binding HxlR family transcriptional regulator